jgi:hypothetical protein
VSEVPIHSWSAFSMDDTARIPRPKFPRNPNGPRGRVEHDSRGNAVWKKTRASDSTEPPDTSILTIVEETTGKSLDSKATHGTKTSDILVARLVKAKRK